MSLWRKLFFLALLQQPYLWLTQPWPTRTPTSTLGRIRRPARVRPRRQMPPVIVIHTATKLGLGTTRWT
jgi:hypothetical protein